MLGWGMGWKLEARESTPKWMWSTRLRDSGLAIAVLAGCLGGMAVESEERVDGAGPNAVANALAIGVGALRVGDYGKFAQACGYWHREIGPLAESGSSQAQLCLVFFHAFGLGGWEQSPALTRQWVERAADGGLPEAKFLLGRRAILQSKSVGDWFRALALLEDAAEGGSVDAQHLLGLREISPAAVSWLRKAAARGCGGAAYELGARYSEGHGVQQSHADAMEWYLDAARKGDVRGQIAVAQAYVEGVGLPRDLALAYAWFNVAAAIEKHAATMRDRLEALMPETGVAEGQRLSRRITDELQSDACGALIPDDTWF